jgi:HSP20 family protein
MNSLIPRTFVSQFLNDPSDLLFKDFFDHDSMFETFFERKISYPVDIKETDNTLEFDVAVVGLEKNDIKIEVKDSNTLAISYNKPRCESINDKYLYRGITQRSFDMAWRISSKFDLTKLSAKLDKGLLKIVVPIAPEKEAKNIEIQD